MSERKVLGFDQYIRLEWLEFTAARVAAGCGPAEVRDALFDLLDGVVGGRRQYSSRSKTVTVLTRIWSRVPDSAIYLQRRAVAALAQVDAQERLALHWAMATGSYGFFHDVGTVIGRLLALQGDVVQASISRRMQEIWGDRVKVPNATQKVTRSIADWGGLEEGATKGLFKPRRSPIRVSGQIAEILLEALLLRNDGQSLEVAQISRHPSLFPFDVELPAHKLRQSPTFEVHRQGLDVDVVRLAAPRGSDAIGGGSGQCA